MGRARFQPSSRDRGAAAVEFALVVPILLAVMFGIVDYGLWFGDSLNIRQGVDEAARRAVVNDFGSCTGASETEKTACVVKERIGAFGGTVYVKVSVIGPAPSKTAGNWAKGGQLLVCAMVKEEGLTGLTPMPKDGILHDLVHKRVEVTAGSSVPDFSDTPPTGSDWAWCA
jgi:TadE-like protein